MYLTARDVFDCAERFWRQWPSKDAKITLLNFLDQLTELADKSTHLHVLSMAKTIQQQDAEIQRLRQELAQLREELERQTGGTTS
jgi:polyhydroxyalkanoate synthesis regulator phasin